MGHEEALWQAWLVGWGLKYLSNGSGALLGESGLGYEREQGRTEA